MEFAMSESYQKNNLPVLRGYREQISAAFRSARATGSPHDRLEIFKIILEELDDRIKELRKTQN